MKTINHSAIICFPFCAEPTRTYLLMISSRRFRQEPVELGNEELWKETVEQIRRDQKQMEALVANPSTDLFAKIPHGTGQTIVREALLVADHNAYHLGALAVISRVLKNL